MNRSQNFQPENYDAFISYKHQSGFYMAQVIYDKLIQNGYSVFMDKHLKRGEFEQQIKDAVERTRNFILVLFPGDLDHSNDENDWLRKEAEWAVSTPNINFIPVFCDDFDTRDISVELPDCLKKVLSSQSIKIHKDVAMDTDLDKLCDIALVNTNPVRPLVNTIDFFNSNLDDKSHLSIKSIDMAFHAGGAWLRAGTQKNILKKILGRKIPTRILINTPEAAESITKHMRDEEAIYVGFEQAVNRWKRYAEEHSDILQVRVSSVPLLRVYHNIKFNEDQVNNTYDRMHIKYYAYQNINLDNSYEHELSSFSKYYKLYQNEFEFL